MSTDFVLDPRLAADTVALVDLPLCTVRLMNDARYAWLVLVPRRAGCVEWSDLSPVDQAALWRECTRAGAALRASVRCDKLNLGVLGNQVRQLHAHIIARRRDDAAWPGPVWGHGAASPYAADAMAARIAALCQALQPDLE